MKGIVIYDSHTGGTKKIAESIHRGMGAAGKETDIAYVREVGPEDLGAYDVIGLGGPVIRQRECYNLSAFIEHKLKNVDGKHGFAGALQGLLYGSQLLSGACFKSPA